MKAERIIIFMIILSGMLFFQNCKTFYTIGVEKRLENFYNGIAKLEEWRTSSPEYWTVINNPNYETCKAFVEEYIKLEDALFQKYPEGMTAENLLLREKKHKKLRADCELFKNIKDENIRDENIRDENMRLELERIEEKIKKFNFNELVEWIVSSHEYWTVIDDNYESCNTYLETLIILNEVILQENIKELPTEELLRIEKETREYCETLR